MTTIGVIGAGVLGRAVSRGFMEHGSIRVYDIDEQRATHTLEQAATSEIVFICLPTPAIEDGRCNTRAIEAFLNQARTEQWWTEKSCYVIRSTVPIGFTESIAAQYLNGAPIFHSPEFLTARCSIVDFQTPSRNIIGSPLVFNAENERINWWKSALTRIADLYGQRFPGVQLLHMRSNASELVKLACNTFFAAKVTLFNLFKEISDAAGVEWEDVRAGILSDGRIAHSHTQVPGPDGKPGFGGACLPKDTANLYNAAIAAGIDALLLRVIIGRNEHTRGDDPGLARVRLPI